VPHDWRRIDIFNSIVLSTAKILAKMSDRDSALLLAQHQAGDQDAATAIFDRYAERLRVLVGQRLSSSVRRRFDSDDVIQSTFRSFFCQAEAGRDHLDQPGDLWRLLAAIALNKLRARANAERASKRDLRQELHFEDDVDGAGMAGLVASDEPRPEEVLAASEVLLRTMRLLDPLPLQVLSKVFQSYGNAEIAKSLGVSERTVRRTIQHIRHKLTDDLLERSPSRVGASSIAVAPGNRNAENLAFSDYILLNMVGRGGVGKVYRARCKRTGAIVAVKTLLKCRQQDPIALGRFVQEGQLLRRLQHSNIVGLHGIGRYPHGGFFLVLDFVDGEDLAARIERDPLPQDEAVRIIAAVAHAVQHAHDCGVLHLDLKPANVLLARDGSAFVTDFGFGALRRPSLKDAATVDGGTYTYMAPEQLDRSLGPVGPAADVFGLGGVLYATLTGRSPRRVSSVEQIAATHAEIWERNATSRAFVMDRSLRRICEACLAPSSPDRMSSPMDVARALKTWISTRGH
jgi:DNA-directed RNA polymerase specialized sigma24 family protein